MTKFQTKVKRKHKPHQAYYNKAGTRLPSCTTITDVMNKPFLVPWANKLGLEGIDVKAYVDLLAKAGTCAHLMVEMYYREREPDVSAFTPDQQVLAKISFGKFEEWQHENNFEPIEIDGEKTIELNLVSEKYQFGGKSDLYGMLHGKRTLLDVKTAKAVYSDHFTQAGGYEITLEENSFPVDDVRILRIGRGENETFECAGINPKMRKLHIERFIVCRELYELNKKIGR